MQTPINNQFNKRLKHLARPVAEFWGVHFKISQEGSGPAFDWNQVMMPQNMTDRSDEEITVNLLHEWGHRCIAPQTVAQGFWWEIIARMEGITASHSAINIATDLIVDHWYLQHPHWAAIYKAHMESFLDKAIQQMAQQNPVPILDQLLFPAYALLSGWSEDKIIEYADISLAKVALFHLFDNRLPLHQRIRLFCRTVVSFFQKQTQVMHQLNHRQQKGGGGDPATPITGVPEGWHGKKWNPEDLIRLLISGGHRVSPKTLEDICGSRQARLVNNRLRILEALTKVEPRVRQLESRLRSEKQEGTRPWHLGDPIQELQVFFSMERFGMLLPGHTTFKHRYIAPPPKNHELPAVCLIMDNSGSTHGAIIQNQLEAAVGLVEACRRFGKDTALIVFGSNVSARIAPGNAYDAITDILAALDGQSGGTELVPAIKQALAYATTIKGRMASVIFTDSYIYDDTAAAQMIPELMDHGPLILFCVETRLDAVFIGAVQELANPPVIVQHRPDQPLIDEALTVFKG